MLIARSTANRKDKKSKCGTLANQSLFLKGIDKGIIRPLLEARV